MFELGSGQCIYLENLGDQTRVTTTSSSPGQQQQSSSGFQTGIWTVSPEAFRVAIGFLVRLHTAQGEQFLHIQGSRLSLLPDAPSLAKAQPIPVQPVAHVPGASLPSMPPMQPMAPMRMGNMQMDRDSMSMEMGNMRLSMAPIARSQDNLPPTSPSDASETPSGQRHFCSQCGAALKSSDRFCANCGHRLD